MITKELSIMKKVINLVVFSILLVIVTSYFSCDVKLFTDDDNDFGSISGIVTDLNKNPIADVKVTIEGNEIYSDSKGLFSIDKVLIGKDQVVGFSKPNHVSNQKVATIELGKNTFVFASLGKWDKSETINPSQENTITFQNAKVKLPANGIVDANGNPFTGDVTVKAAYFDPMSDNYGDVFPGDFEGEDMSGNIVPIESYGFINVELTGGNQILNLASGSTADISIPIPDALKANAPNPIPLWFFDEELGIWKEEGSATIQNGVYVGEVSHFTAWNADFLFEVSSIKGRVVCKDGSPLPNARIKVRGVDYSSTTYKSSDTNGYYEIDVKANAVVDINAIRLTGLGTILSTSQTVRVNTKNSNEIKTIEDLMIDCDDDYEHDVCQRT